MKTFVSYSPMFFLSALGPGGLSVSFFMYLMFLVPRDPSLKIPTFESLLLAWQTGPLWMQIMIGAALVGIFVFAGLHIWSLIWNIGQYRAFKKTPAYTQMKHSPSEVGLITLPLTFAMTINVMFILGAISIPGLWNIVEYLFPLALAGFSITGFFALRIFTTHLQHIFSKIYSLSEVSHLGQLLWVFGFVMTGVGFSASAAMSTTPLTIGLGLMGSVFFLSLAFIFGAIYFFLGLRAISEHGFDASMSPSIWIIIPLLTLAGITLIRQSHGMHAFGGHSSPAFYLILTSGIFLIQLFFGYVGYHLMRRNGYFTDFLTGKEKTPGTYGLICPGVALVVFGFFFLHTGLVKNDIISQFGILYFVILSGLVFIQIRTIQTLITLQRKFFG